MTTVSIHAHFNSPGDFKMKTLTLKDYILAVPVLILALKSMMILNYVLSSRRTVEITEVTNKLESIYDVEKDVFNILNKTNISFVLRPVEACRSEDNVMIVLSAPKNIEKRAILRAQFSDRKDIKLIFLEMRKIRFRSAFALRFIPKVPGHILKRIVRLFCTKMDVQR